MTVQNWTDEVADALERLNVADTLEELRHHIDALIDRLGKQEPQSEQGSEVAAQPDGLDRQIDSLGRKVESASSMLAQLTDLLESQSERIETIVVTHYPSSNSSCITSANKSYKPSSISLMMSMLPVSNQMV